MDDPSPPPTEREQRYEEVTNWIIGLVALPALGFILHGLFVAGRTLVSPGAPVNWEDLVRREDLPHRVLVTGFAVADAASGEAAAADTPFAPDEAPLWRALVAVDGAPTAEPAHVWVRVNDAERGVATPCAAYVSLHQRIDGRTIVALREMTPARRFLGGLAEVGASLAVLFVTLILYERCKPKCGPDGPPEPET